MAITTFNGPVASQNGFIENSFTTAQRDAIADPQEGLLIYNTTTNTYEVYNGTSWQDAFGGGGGATTTYALNTDYSSGGLIASNQFGANFLQVTEGSWNNSNYNTLLAQPVGTVFTIVAEGQTFEFTSSNVSGTQIIGTFSGSVPFLYFATLVSISFTIAPAPSGSLWGTSAWGDNNYTVNSIDVAGTGSPGPSDFSFMGMSVETRDVLLAYPIGTVFTVVHGTGITAGDTFTLTSQFSGGGGMYQANATYAGGGYMVGMAMVSQFIVA